MVFPLTPQTVMQYIKKELSSGMKARCQEGTGSTCLLLPSLSQLSLLDKDSDNEKQEELSFYNDDGTFQKVIVEENLIASDLCQLLSVRNRVPRDAAWTIVESWPALSLERSLEDHEEVLKVHRETSGPKRFLFRRQPSKYDLFTNPASVLPPSLMKTVQDEADQTPPLHSLSEEIVVPPVFTAVWYKDNNKNEWTKTYLILNNYNIYMSSQIELVARLVHNRKHYSLLDESDQTPVGSEGWEEVDLIGDVREVQVYSCINSKRQTGAPTEFGITLRPSHKEHFSSSICLSALSAWDRLFWITTMRLAKYGKQLRENYRSFKNKQIEQSSPKEYAKNSLSNECIRPRVAMDFTGSVGRIVDDPTEANAIALSEGLAWKKRWRTTNANLIRSVDQESLATQPWFHKGMSRQEATNVIRAPSHQDGVFLVRESRSNPGCFVLTLKCASKVVHIPIEPIMDVVKDTVCFTMDSGVTKFYDVLQLIEFYQLNAGCLPTRLTSYVSTQ